MKKQLFILLTAIVSSIAIAVFAFTILKNNADARKQDELQNQIRVVNNTRNLEVLDVKIRSSGDGRFAEAIIEVRNNSDKPIIAIGLESGNEKEASGTNLNGFNDGDVPPSIILKPHESIKINFPLSYIHPGFPIRISGVMYADGTEDGEEITLGTMHKQKEHYKNKRKGESLPQ